jgi:hypothetical protein
LAIDSRRVRNPSISASSFSRSVTSAATAGFAADASIAGPADSKRATVNRPAAPPAICGCSVASAPSFVKLSATLREA